MLETNPKLPERLKEIQEKEGLVPHGENEGLKHDAEAQIH